MNRLAYAVLGLAVISCSHKTQSGLAPAEDWSADQSGTLVPTGSATGPLAPHGGLGADDPHAGVDMNGEGGGDPGTADPHAGLGIDPARTANAGDNPHAGLDMSGGGGTAGADPHAGMDINGAGGDVTKLGLAAPDPNRALDPNHFVRGVIKLGPHAAGKATAGGVVFVVVKHVDASGQGAGSPLAVDRLTWPTTGDLPFELSEAQAMVAGTTFDGDVVVTAHYDQDGEARSKQPGDILGEAHVTVPADHVVLMLDNVLP